LKLNKLIIGANQAQLGTPLDTLINASDLEGQLEAFLLACRIESLSPATLKYYRDKIGCFINFCQRSGIMLPEEVTASHVRSFIGQLQLVNKPGSVHCYYRAIKRYFNWMILEEVMENHPMRTIHPPRVPRHVIQPFSSADVIRMLQYCELAGNFNDIRNRAIILVFMDTGIRLSELCNIQLTDIDLLHETIRIMGKGVRERVVRISTATQKAIITYVKRRSDGYPCLWVSEERQPLKCASAIRQMIVKVGKLSGVKGIRCSPHTFRHYFATSALHAGALEFEVQSLLGHSTLTMTRKYTETLRSEEAVEGHRGTATRKGFSPVANLGLK
jgi:integrase/recombinase XerC